MVDLAALAEEPYPALALMVGGLLSLFIAVYGRRDDSYLDEVGTLFAFLVGIAMFIMAFFIGTEGDEDWLTLTIFVVLAVTLFLKPMKELPWAGLLGVIFGAIAAFGASRFLSGSIFGVDEWIVLVVIFLVVGAIVHTIFHFLEDVLTIATMVVNWKPVMVLIGIVALAEGALLLMDRSILGLL